MYTCITVHQAILWVFHSKNLKQSVPAPSQVNFFPGGKVAMWNLAMFLYDLFLTLTAGFSCKWKWGSFRYCLTGKLHASSRACIASTSFQTRFWILWRVSHSITHLCLGDTVTVSDSLFDQRWSQIAGKIFPQYLFCSLSTKSKSTSQMKSIKCLW